MSGRVTWHGLWRRALAATLFIAVCLGSHSVISYAAHADKADLVTLASDKQKKDPTIVINISTAEVIDIEGEIADIMVADPGVVEVQAIQSNKLYVVGLGLGSTNIIAIDAQGNVIKRLNVHVEMDVDNAQRSVEENFPGEDIVIRALRGQIVITGSVSSADIAQQVQNFMTHYVTEVEEDDGSPDEKVVNLLSVRGKSQVMLRVKVLEVARTVLRQRGSDTQIQSLGATINGNITNSPRVNSNGTSLFSGVDELGLSEDPFAVVGLLESFGGFGPVDIALELLEREGLAKILAEPNLTAISGEQAGFLAGGEFPVPSGRDSQGNIEVTFRRFGVTVNFRPMVLSEDRISMQLETEVSSIARDSQVVLEDVEVPGLDVRRATTTVEMGSGGTLMIAGLLQSQTLRGLSGIPGMLRAPIIGQLMSSDTFRREETELVILVTPYLVEPYGDKRQSDNKVPLSDREPTDLANAFSRNIRRTYTNVQLSNLFDGDQTYGYLIE